MSNTPSPDTDMRNPGIGDPSGGPRGSRDDLGARGLYVLGILIHILAVYIGYTKMDLLGAILTLVLPIFSEVFWMVALYFEKGTIWNLLTEAVMVYVALWAVLGIVKFLFQSGSR